MPAVRAAPTTMTVMAFNVLCQIYEPAAHPHLASGACHFGARFPNVCRTITAGDCDVVCLNECQPITAYRSAFSATHTVLHWSKTGPGTPTLDDLKNSVDDSDDGTAMLLKNGVVDVIHAEVLRASEVNRRGQQTPSRQFTLAAVVRFCDTGKLAVVATMHMKANWMDHNKVDHSMCPRRVRHLSQILPQLRSFGKQFVAPTEPRLPVVFCGDFNAQPGTPTMELLTKGIARDVPVEGHGVDGDTTTVVNDSFAFVSAMAATSAGREPAFTILDSSYSDRTGPPQGWGAVLDYILVEQGTDIVSAMPMPTREAFGHDAVPHTGSDHVPVAVTLRL
jgi:endonuclease/exonuclease/phosphatase family metal-dependent hydrolase